AAAARRFRLPGKGRIEVGGDADLCLVDLSAEWRLQASELRYRHPMTPFLDRPLRGRVVRAMVRGRTVLAGGDYVPGPCGRLVTPTAG
ncbi:MAG: allantoinase, partial [Candidatus Dormibacteraceae bacterium]